MPNSAALELQAAIYTALSEDDAVVGLLAPPKNFTGLPANTPLMLFDKVPDAVMQSFVANGGVTYATLGDGSERYELAGDDDRSDDEDTIEITRHTLAFHVYSQKVGLLEVKAIAIAMRTAIVNAWRQQRLTLPANRIIHIDASALAYDRLNDGFTSHAGLAMTCSTQPAT